MTVSEEIIVCRRPDKSGTTCGLSVIIGRELLRINNNLKEKQKDGEPKLEAAALSSATSQSASNSV